MRGERGEVKRKEEGEKRRGEERSSRALPFGLSPCLGNGCVMTLGQVRTGRFQVHLISVPLPDGVTHSFHFSLSAVSTPSHHT